MSTSTTKPAHTPLPWIVSRNNAGAIPVHFQPPEILGRNGNCCVASKFGNGPEAEANAALIVKAVNAYAPALAALKAAQSALNQIPRKSLSGEHKDSYAVASLVDAAVKAMEGAR